MSELKKQREIRKLNHDILRMKNYIFFALFGENKPFCQECKATRNIEIHHKRYDVDVTIYDLDILCHKCHVKKDNRIRLDYIYKD